MSNSNKPYRQSSSSWQQQTSQIRQQLKKDLITINNLLNVTESIKNVNNIMNECTKIIKLNQDQEKQRNLIWKYDQKYDYQFKDYEEDPMVIQIQSELPFLQVQSKRNWIQQYLDRDNVKIYGKVRGQSVKVLAEKEKLVTYQNISIENCLQSDVEDRNICEISFREFQNQNKEIRMQFINNKYFYQMGNSLVCVDLCSVPENQKTTFILSLQHNQSPQTQSIRRVLIFRLQNVQNQSSRGRKKEEYRMYEGFYESQNFKTVVDLPPARYIFMPFSNTNLAFYAPYKQKFAYILEQQRKQIKQLNLMLQAFPQCHPMNMKAEFVRQCDLSAGIVIQIYQNLYENQIFFKESNERTYPKEDKRLMFRGLYSERYRSYRLRKGETIVQFFEVTAKPAVLYQPQKRVFIDREEDHNAKIIHSILK